MAGYDDPAEELYYMDDTAGSFDQDLVYALDAGVRHSVNQALVQAIQPIQHHLLGLVEQQAWAAPGSASTLEDPSFATIPQSEKQLSNPHAADFQSLIRNMAREHDYNAGSHKKGVVINFHDPEGPCNLVKVLIKALRMSIAHALLKKN
ncbi:hypothetical protein NDU88_006636 [Pleurodeles waltl]|uniref:Uncharacterized protein n=1 Tax=Pleurodeles waltl TaxID=8319 RepID=A0AAV7MGB6_PLEWA|nr:hypothetical protein NDU88_006636 [Pleurodeles waltl]